MSLYDRDYMKRPSGEDSDRPGPPDEKLEAFFSGFLARHPRLPIVVIVTLVALVILAIVIIKLSSPGH